MRLLSKYSMVISTLVLCGLLFLFFNNLREGFSEVLDNYANQKAINLSAKTDKKVLADLLVNNGYVANRQDADFIADTITSRLKRLKYTNLYNLQKRAYGQVPALTIDSLNACSKNKILAKKLAKSYEAVGLFADIPSLSELTSNVNLNIVPQKTAGTIKVQLYSDDNQTLSDAVVRLSAHYLDSLRATHSEVIAYAKTDSKGVAIFSGLDKQCAYSVLPIKRGCEYGSSNGVKLGKFKKDVTFEFKQLEHRFPMIDNATLKRIKNDGTITVRTPEEYKAEVVKWFVLVLLAWWILVFVLTLRKQRFDSLLIAAALFLSGLSVIVMFAIQNPLTEALHGADMARGVLIGICAILLLQFVDFVKLYQNSLKIDFDIPLAIVRWIFLPFKQKVSWLAYILTDNCAWYKKLAAMLLLVLCLPFAIFNLPFMRKANQFIVRHLERLPKGFGWLLSAILITALLWTPLGREIGGMKVNLHLFGLTFQPSEMAKYLILFYMAAFFAQNADTIIAYSRPDRTQIFNKLITLAWVIGGLLLLMLLYAALGDMGPALVIGITFVLLYSVVKSKVSLENLSEDDKWKRILTCDFAMLVYGVLSFAAFIVVGVVVGYAIIFAILWFVAWICMGVLWRRQFFETAFILNLLAFVFVFGGDLASHASFLQDTDVAQRFEQRTRMCVNTWGNLDLVGKGANAEPVSNTQVANGLWAIATGGMTGQGIGEGNPNLIPAFHTDMILSSISEQLGWWGLLVIVVVIALMLRRIVIIGYRVGHPFAFYFCLGVAIVTAVQFFVIALGSSGMIPLTGVAVPFLSYGRVSLILNLTALGVVIAFAKNISNDPKTHVQEKIARHSVGNYNFPIAIVTLTYIALAVFTLGVWQYYAFWAREDTLTHRAFVYSPYGLPIIEYNPRIALLTKEMWAGDIYDRNGLLLATSDNNKLSAGSDDYKKLLKAGVVDSCYMQRANAKTPRYYPFGEHLFFMLGDLNTGMRLNYDNGNPIGYMAEIQHLSYLRNFNNLRDAKGKPTQVVFLKGGINKAADRYLSNAIKDTVDTLIRYRLRDYHQVAKFLKSGIHGRALRNHNQDVRLGEFDLHLSVDAALQVDIQRRLKRHVEANSALKNDNLLRISVVIMDAKNGDMLTSANYPLPDYTRQNEASYYSDNYRHADWQAYTDRDLGLTYQTMPGSTAKVMSAMAGFEKMGTDAADKSYLITEEEIIEKGSTPEPYGHVVTMKEAIVRSSNCYFINLVNENDLYWELDSIYEAVGVSIGGVIPYYLNYVVDDSIQSKFREKVRYNQDKALVKYAQRQEEESKKNMNEGEWRWAWGQGYRHYELQASPLNLVRVAAAIANRGRMPYTQFLMHKNEYEEGCEANGYVSLLSTPSANMLKEYMLAEATNQFARNGVLLPDFVGGKTGTPERYHYLMNGRQEKRNDGWYMFFVDGHDGKHPLAVCVRMERLQGTGSSAAVKLAKSVVLESLYSKGYINIK